MVTKQQVHAAAREWAQNNWISIVVLLFALGASAASTAVSYVYANSSISELTQSSLETTSVSISNEISNYLDEQTSLLTPIVADLFASGSVNTTDSTTVDLNRTIATMYRWSNITKVYCVFIVNSDGNSLAINRDPTSPTPTVSMVWQRYIHTLTYYPLNTDGSWDFNTPLSTVDFTDATTYGPYQSIKKSGVAEWEPPYVFGSLYPQLLLPRCLPIFTVSDGSYYGISCVIIGIDIWQNIISAYKIGKTGSVFIANENGDILASSRGGSQYVVSDDSSAFRTITFNTATKNSDPVLAQAAIYLQQKYKVFANIPNAAHGSLKINDKTYLTYVSRITRDNLVLLIVLVIPESDFTGNIVFSRKISTIITIVAVVFGSLKYIPWKWLWLQYLERRRHRGIAKKRLELIHIDSEASTQVETPKIMTTDPDVESAADGGGGGKGNGGGGLNAGGGSERKTISVRAISVALFGVDPDAE